MKKNTGCEKRVTEAYVMKCDLGYHFHKETFR